MALSAKSDTVLKIMSTAVFNRQDVVYLKFPGIRAFTSWHFALKSVAFF
jgi:hypothetical protein